jgi:hypothetical protein
VIVVAWSESERAAIGVSKLKMKIFKYFVVFLCGMAGLALYQAIDILINDWFAKDGFISLHLSDAYVIVQPRASTSVVTALDARAVCLCSRDDGSDASPRFRGFGRWLGAGH